MQTGLDLFMILKSPLSYVVLYVFANSYCRFRSLVWPGILFCYTYFSTFADTLVLATIRGGGKTVHVVFNYMSRSLSPNFYMFKDPMSRFQGIDSASLACATIFKLLRSPGIDSKEINSASLCSLAGRCDNPIPTRFLAPIDC
jgi:hypothetical protein